MLKCMNPELFQVVLNPPAEWHAAAHVLILGNVVLYKDGSRLRTVSGLKKQSEHQTSLGTRMYFFKQNNYYTLLHAQ